MLSVNINQDVEKYQETIAFGLNAKQTIAALLALAAGVGITCLLYFGAGLPVEVSIYVSLPICVPIMLPALGKQYGLTLMERVKQSNKRKKVLVYSMETLTYKRGSEEKESREEKRLKGGSKNRNGKEKKNKKKRPFPADKEQV